MAARRRSRTRRWLQDTRLRIRRRRDRVSLRRSQQRYPLLSELRVLTQFVTSNRLGFAGARTRRTHVLFTITTNTEFSKTFVDQTTPSLYGTFVLKTRAYPLGAIGSATRSKIDAVAGVPFTW